MTSAANAQGTGSQFGFLYGLSVPDAENTNPFEMYGVRGSTLLAPIFGMGGYFYKTSTDDIGTGGQPFKYSLAGVEAAFHISGNSGETLIGTRIGISKVHTRINGENLIFSPYHYGVFSGYDYPLATWMTIGFEGSFLYVQDDSTNSASSSQKLDSFSVLTFLVSLQFRL